MGLNAWLERIADEELRSTLRLAFGVSDDFTSTDMPVTEAVFLEFYSDLAPLADISAALW